jgi:hypothetical protein
MLLKYRWCNLLIELAHLFRTYGGIPWFKQIVFFSSYPGRWVHSFLRTELFDRCCKEGSPLNMMMRMQQWCFYKLVAILIVGPSPIIKKITKSNLGILPFYQSIQAFGDGITVPSVFLHMLRHFLKQIDLQQYIGGVQSDTVQEGISSGYL